MYIVKQVSFFVFLFFVGGGVMTCHQIDMLQLDPIKIKIWIEAIFLQIEEKMFKAVLNTETIF